MVYTIYSVLLCGSVFWDFVAIYQVWYISARFFPAPRQSWTGLRLRFLVMLWVMKYSIVAAVIGVFAVAAMACSLYIGVIKNDSQYLLQVVLAVVPYWLGSVAAHNSATHRQRSNIRRRKIRAQ